MKQRFKSNKSFDDVKGSDAKEPRVEDLVDLYKFPANQWVQVRFIGPLTSYGRHWIETKKNDGSKTKFPKTCLSYDPETEEHDSTKSCPWCDVQDERVRFNPEYYTNAIIREIEEDGPGKKSSSPSKTEAKSGIKERGSKSWTPVRVIRLTPSMIREIKKIGGLNRHKDKKTGEKKAFSVSHEKYGCDIMIEFNPDEKVASKKYAFQKGDASPLSDEQQEYLVYQIEDMIHPDKKKDAEKEVKRWLEKMGKKKSKDEESDDDDDSDDEDEDSSDDDDDAPKGKVKKSKDKKPSKSKSDDDDEDEDDDDLPEEDEDEDDEDEPKGKKSKSKDKKKSKSKDDEDEDDLDDDEDEDSSDDDEDDEPKSKKNSKKSKSKSDDDDDLDDEDELEDDEDEPKSKKSKNKGKVKKSKSDDDDEDEDEDLDDDEDDKPKKGKKGKSDKKSKKKSKDEDDEDDLDDDD